MTDKIFRWTSLLAALMIPVLLFAIVLRLAASSVPAWETFGLGFLTSDEWNPGASQYGALPAVTGTIITTLFAVVIAVPLGVVTAFYLTQIPRRLAAPLSLGLDLLAAIPSVIYGMWGLFVLVPVMQRYVQPFFVRTLGLGNLPFVGESYNGFGCFTAGLVLALMILPYLSAVMRDVFAMTPPLLKESAFGLGCTRWETARDIVLRYGRRGVLGGIFIGLGRALGETMAVLFVIGSINKVPNSVFDSSTTIAATLANHFAEADSLLRSVLFALGLILLLGTFFLQIFAQFFLHRTRMKRSR